MCSSLFCLPEDLVGGLYPSGLVLRGRCAWTQVLEYLESLGFACPTNFNPADFILGLASYKVGKTGPMVIMMMMTTIMITMMQKSIDVTLSPFPQ
jgi:hypothetical protein